MEENKFTQFFKRHYWTCLLALSTIVVLAIGAERYLSNKNSTSKQDYFAVLKYTSRHKQSEPLSVQSTDQLENILARRPELHPHYDALLALSFLHQENAQKTIAHGSETLKRGEKRLSPYFVAYAKTSLLICEGNYAQALVEAKQLEEKLEKESAFETLHAFNLLRLSFLGKKLGQSEIQKQAFEKLQAMPNYAQLEELFKDGSYTLREYLS